MRCFQYLPTVVLWMNIYQFRPDKPIDMDLAEGYRVYNSHSMSLETIYVAMRLFQGHVFLAWLFPC